MATAAPLFFTTLQICHALKASVPWPDQKENGLVGILQPWTVWQVLQGVVPIDG